MSDFGIANDTKTRQADRAIEERPPQKGQNKQERAIQTRALKSLLRRGTALPGGSQVLRTNGDPDSVFASMDSIARGMWGGTIPRWAETQAGIQINAALGRSNFSADMIPVNHPETSGINMNWTGSVTLRIENPVEISSGTGTMTAGGGGSTATATGTSSSSTDSASVTGGVKAGDAKAGGEVSGGATAGTSSTTGSSTTTTNTGNATTSAATRDDLKRYRANIIANISLRAEPDFSGSDYINPFKWGFAGAAAATGPVSGSGVAQAGTVEYQVTTGIAAAPAGG